MFLADAGTACESARARAARRSGREPRRELAQERLLGPLFGIGDPRTDARIDFVGGVRGTTDFDGASRAARRHRVRAAPDAYGAAHGGRGCRQAHAAEVHVVPAEARRRIALARARLSPEPTLRGMMHPPIPEQGRDPRLVLNGFYNYHTVPTSSLALVMMREPSSRSEARVVQPSPAAANRRIARPRKER